MISLGQRPHIPLQVAQVRKARLGYEDIQYSPALGRKAQHQRYIFRRKVNGLEGAQNIGDSGQGGAVAKCPFTFLSGVENSYLVIPSIIAAQPLDIEVLSPVRYDLAILGAANRLANGQV